MNNAKRAREFLHRFGYEVSPWCAAAITCSNCGAFIVPMRKGYYTCEKDLCGPIYTTDSLVDRLMKTGRLGDDVPAMLFLNDFVKAFKKQQRT